jgi:hypothetical protein
MYLDFAVLVIKVYMSWDSSVGNSDGLRAGCPRLDSRQGQEIFFYPTASRSDLKTIQPSIQWLMGVISPGVKATWARS